MNPALDTPQLSPSPNAKVALIYTNMRFSPAGIRNIFNPRNVKMVGKQVVDNTHNFNVPAATSTRGLVRNIQATGTAQSAFGGHYIINAPIPNSSYLGDVEC